MTEQTPSSQGSSQRPSHRPPGGPEALVGVVLSDRYKIVKLIGEGGMGAVYQAEHTHMHKRLAVKVLHPEMSRLNEVVARFEREAMAASHIDHPNVAAATDFGKLDDGSFFLVLEYIEGVSLRDLIANGPIELRRALRITRQIASALGRAHSLGIVHRDLKPENVMLVHRDGDPDFVKVLDFGIAKVPVGELAPDAKAGTALTQLGMVYGTPEYMAPEQALGQEVDGRADLYALGVILFEMLAGKRPYENESKVTLLGMHVTAPIPRVSDKNPSVAIPDEVEQILRTLMAKESKKRFAGAKELVDAIDVVLGVPTASRPSIADRAPSAPSVLPQVVARVESAIDKIPIRTTRRNKLFVLGGAFALTGIAGIVILVLIVRALIAPRDAEKKEAGAVVSDDGAVVSTTADIPVTEKIARLSARIDRGEAAAAVPELEQIEANNPDLSDVHKALCKGYAALGERAKMVKEAGEWGSRDPEGASRDDRIARDVRSAALEKETQDAAFDVLETKLGTAGPDALYDIAYGNVARGQPATILRAKKSLMDDDVKKHMSPALAVTMKIRTSSNICETRAKYFAEAKRSGDLRTIEALAPYLHKTGCGFLNSRDCFPCLRGGEDSVEAVIAAIRARSKK